MKRHKKHKKHKHKHTEYDSSDNIDIINDVPITPAREYDQSLESTSTTTTTVTMNAANQSSSAGNSEKLKQPLAGVLLAGNNGNASIKGTPSSTKSNNKKRNRKGKESGTSSDEERWLDAIESGKLEEVDDELKKIKDPKLMTARQRAMYDRGNDKDMSFGSELLMALPSGYKEKVMTAEAIQKAQIKSQKRKQMADEKREKDKKKTMERLLKKQDTKQRSQGKNKVAKASVPMITYKNTIEGSLICLPIEHEFPLKAQGPKSPPKPILCSIVDCNNIKAYNCSKTNVPLCSFACYRKNVASIKNIIC